MGYSAGLGLWLVVRSGTLCKPEASFSSGPYDALSSSEAAESTGEDKKSKPEEALARSPLDKHIHIRSYIYVSIYVLPTTPKVWVLVFPRPPSPLHSPSPSPSPIKATLHRCKPTSMQTNINANQPLLQTNINANQHLCKPTSM